MIKLKHFTKLILTVSLMLAYSLSNFAQVSISHEGFESHPSAILELISTDKGLLIPRMSTSERDNMEDVLDSDAESLLIYNKDKKCFETYIGGEWHEFWCCDRPSQPDPISGASSPCANATGELYSVPEVSGATSYSWSVPSGWTITDGGSTSEITVTVGDVGDDGDITVSAENACGEGESRTLSLTVDKEKPDAPVAEDATDVEGDRFTANWQSVVGADHYLLDVSTCEDFSESDYVDGYEQNNVGDVTSHQVTDLEGETIYYYRVYAVNDCGTSEASNEIEVETVDLCFDPEPCEGMETVTFTYRGEEVTYRTTKGENGTCWMDRNLGAIEYDDDDSDTDEPSSYTDSDFYGHLFQWGRGDDGHQERNSPTSEANACVDTDTPGHNTFLRAATACNFDWRTGHNDDLWQGDGGINDPCPSGWRLPTESELEAEMTAFTSNDYLGAYCSTLRFTRNGLRTGTNIGSMGCYWTSDPHSSINYGAMGMFFEFGDWDIEGLDRFYGCAVRCIKD